MESIYTLVGGRTGSWQIESIRAVTGESLPMVARLDIRNEDARAAR